MTERQVDTQQLTQRALDVVNSLKEIVINRERTYPPSIEAVLVFSGPGTYYDKLKPDQEEWMRWMDRDRIRAGVAVVSEITAARLSDLLGKKVKGHQISPGDILLYGPYFVYNGTPLENEIFRKALNSPFCKLPKEKVIILDEVKEDDGTVHPHRHTADQVKSFYQQLTIPKSPLSRVTNVALVAHIPDFARNVFYTRKYNDEFVESGNRSLNFWVYGLKSRKGTGEAHLNSEFPRIVTYAQRGHLATEPSPFAT